MPEGAKAPLMVCPYTGEKLEIEALGGEPPAPLVYRASGGFDPMGYHKSAKALTRMLKMRSGSVSRVKNLKCAYLGTPISVKRDEATGMYFVHGTFRSPRALYSHPDEVRWAVSWRNGVEPAFPMRTELTVGEESEEHSDPTLGLGADAELEEVVREQLDRE